MFMLKSLNFLYYINFIVLREAELLKIFTTNWFVKLLPKSFPLSLNVFMDFVICF